LDPPTVDDYRWRVLTGRWADRRVRGRRRRAARCPPLASPTTPGQRRPVGDQGSRRADRPGVAPQTDAPARRPIRHAIGDASRRPHGRYSSTTGAADPTVFDSSDIARKRFAGCPFRDQGPASLRHNAKRNGRLRQVRRRVFDTKKYPQDVAAWLTCEKIAHIPQPSARFVPFSIPFDKESKSPWSRLDRKGEKNGEIFTGGERRSLDSAETDVAASHLPHLDRELAGESNHDFDRTPRPDHATHPKLVISRRPKANARHPSPSHRTAGRPAVAELCQHYHC